MEQNLEYVIDQKTEKIYPLNLNNLDILLFTYEKEIKTLEKLEE